MVRREPKIFNDHVSEQSFCLPTENPEVNGLADNVASKRGTVVYLN